VNSTVPWIQKYTPLQELSREKKAQSVNDFYNVPELFKVVSPNVWHGKLLFKNSAFRRNKDHHKLDKWYYILMILHYNDPVGKFVF